MGKYKIYMKLSTGVRLQLGHPQVVWLWDRTGAEAGLVRIIVLVIHGLHLENL